MTAVKILTQVLTMSRQTLDNDGNENVDTKKMTPVKIQALDYEDSEMQTLDNDDRKIVDTRE